jgi:hypothetical protein
VTSDREKKKGKSRIPLKNLINFEDTEESKRFTDELPI